MYRALKHDSSICLIFMKFFMQNSHTLFMCMIAHLWPMGSNSSALFKHRTVFLQYLNWVLAFKMGCLSILRYKSAPDLLAEIATPLKNSFANTNFFCLLVYLFSGLLVFSLHKTLAVPPPSDLISARSYSG